MQPPAAGHTINFNISTPDASSFQRSQGQLMSKANTQLTQSWSRR